MNVHTVHPMYTPMNVKGRKGYLFILGAAFISV